MTLRVQLFRVYRQHAYELTWWASWLVVALAWALWTVLR